MTWSRRRILLGLAAAPFAAASALETTRDFAGATGAITFSPMSHVPSKTVTVIALRDGKPTPAAHILPKRVPPP